MSVFYAMAMAPVRIRATMFGLATVAHVTICQALNYQPIITRVSIMANAITIMVVVHTLVCHRWAVFFACVQLDIV